MCRAGPASLSRSAGQNSPLLSTPAPTSSTCRGLRVNSCSSLGPGSSGMCRLQCRCQSCMLLSDKGLGGFGGGSWGFETAAVACGVLGCPENRVKFGNNDAAAKGSCRALMEKLSLLTPCIFTFVHNTIPKDEPKTIGSCWWSTEACRTTQRSFCYCSDQTRCVWAASATIEQSA